MDQKDVQGMSSLSLNMLLGMQMYTGHMQREYVPMKERGDKAGELKSPLGNEGHPATADMQGLDTRAVSCNTMRVG